MANYNEEDVQWLYDRMVDDGVDAGTIDDFKESLKSDVDRDWYHKRAKRMGLDVGDAAEFRSWTVPDDDTQEESQQVGGTVVDQAVDANNRATGHMPQDVQDVAFSGQPQMGGQSLAEKNNPQMFEKPADNPEPWKAEGLTKEQYEDIAWMRQANRPTSQGMINGEVWTPEEARAGEREQRPRTYQTRESWDDDIYRKPSKYGQMRAGWRRGQRYRQLNRDGAYLGGYVGSTDAEAAAAAEQMSDQQLIETYNKLSQQINKNYEGGIGGFAKTPEGQQLGAQLNAIGKELHFRDLGYEHTSSVPGRGDVDYRTWMSEPDVAEEASRLSNVGNRDAEVAQLYLEGMTNGNMEAAERAMLASAALYCKENNIDMDTAYSMVETNAFNTAMRGPLQADVDKIYQEEKDVQSQKQTEAISGMGHAQSAGESMYQQLAMRRAAPTREMLNTMAHRAISESAASRAYYNMRLREYMRGGSMDIMHARAAAMNDVRNLFRDIEVAKATPNSSWGIVANSFIMENMPVQAIRGLANLATGDYESDMIIDEGMARAKASAGVMTNVLAGVAPFVADSALGSFKIPGLVGKGVSTGLTKLTTWSLNRVFGLGEEAMMRRLGGSWVYRTVMGSLSGSANFGTYMSMSAAVQGFRQGNASWEGTWEGAKHGLWDGLAFGGVNGSMSKIVESAKGGWAIAAEAGALTTEAGVFTALDYMRTGEITAESVGQSLGMVLASRAMNFRGWASDVAARVTGTKWQHQVKGPVKWSKETRNQLQDRYPTLCRLMGGDSLAKDLVQGSTGKANRKTGNLKEVDAVNVAMDIEREWDAMQNDPTVDFAIKRMANYVLNGQIVPTPAVCNWRVTEPGEDGMSYGETIDINGNVIERFKLKDDDERRRFEQGVAVDAERNRIGLEQAAWGSRELEPVIVDAIDAVASAHGLDRDELAKAYFTEDAKIKGTVMKAAVKEAEALVIAEMRTKTNPQAAVERKYGVDLEEVRKTPIKDRTEAEQQALDEYELRLTDRYDESQDKSTAELIAEEQQQSHDDGYKAEGDQRADLKEQLEDAANTLTEMRIDPRQFDGMTEEQVSSWLESRGNNEEEIDAVLDYLNAKAAFEGVKDKVQDVATDRIEQVNKETDSQTNKVTGQIHRVTVKPEGENNPGRDAVVVDGKITIDENGDVDRENSDKTIVVKYADQEEPAIIPIEDVMNGEQPLDPESVKQESADAITQEEVGKAVDEMNRTLAFNEGDVVTILAEGQPVELTVVGYDPATGDPVMRDRNGNQMAVSREVMQQMHDEWREWEKNGRPQQEQPVEQAEKTEVTEQPVEQPKQEEQKPAAMPTPGGDPQEMLDYFRASGMSDMVADKTITNNIVAAAERLEKAQRELEESKETDPQKLAELEKKVDEAQRGLDYWNEVGRRKWGNTEQQAAPVAENDMQPVEEPQQANGETQRMTAEGVDPDAEYSGLGMSFETRERLEDGSGIVGLIDALARELGLKIRTFDGAVGAPGYTDRDNGIIWVNNNRRGRGFRQTLGHEIIHGLKQEAQRQGKPELYTALRDAVLEHVKMQKGEDYESYYDGMVNLYRKGLFNYGKQRALDAGASEADAVRAGWKSAGVVDKDYIDEEIVCDAIGDLLDGDIENASRMLEGIKDKSLLQNIKDYFINLLNKVKSAFKKDDGSEPTPEELAIDRVIANFEKMYKDLIEGRREEMKVEAEHARIEDEGVHSIEQAAAQDGNVFSFKNEGDLQDKLRKYAKTTDGKRLKWNAEKINEVISETADLIRAVHAAMSGDPFYDEFAAKNPTIRFDWRDGEEHPVVTWSRNNVEYKYDMSADLLCVNNDGLEEVLSSPMMCDLMVKMFENEIAKNGGKTYTVKKETDKETGEVKEKKEYFAGGFTSEDYINLYNMLRDMGFVVPCRGCFDAAARLKMLPSVSQKFENQVNDVIAERAKDPEAYDAALREEARQAQIQENERARRKGEKPKRKVGKNGFPLAAPTKEAAIRVAVAADNLTEPITYSQLMSAQGQTEMLSDWGSIFRAWQRTGAGRPKDKLLPEPYTGDVVESTYTIIGPADKRTPNFRDKEVNQGTSLRRNSHSELRPYTIIDEIQFMRDAFVRNLCVFKYMKELDDVRLFGQMGVKFNMSFFPAHNKDGVASGLDADGNYTAAEESVGAREFPYTGADGQTHYDGLRGWEEAQKYCNDDVSLSTVIFSMPHMVKVLTDVPTPEDPSGRWGSAIPFHASGATAKQLFLQGLGWARAIDSDHPFEQEAFVDWDKGVTNFEQVQNDRFDEGWVAVGGKNDGKDMTGHKLEFATSSHYYNERLGLHMFRGMLVTDEAYPGLKFNKDGTLNKKATKGVEGVIPMDIDYNNKVRELGGDYAYKDASDYYIQFMQEHGIIPRFHFNVPEEAFLRACEAAKDETTGKPIDPTHPKLGWKGPGNDWSPIDSPAYYSMFCDYGMTKADGKWSPQRPVGVLNERGEREFRMPANTVDIATEAMRRYTERRQAENAKVNDAVSRFADMMVEQGKVTREQVDEALSKTTFSERDSRVRTAADPDNIDVKFSLVKDPIELAHLESEPTLEGYRNVSMQEDGTFRSPMADKLGRKGKKKRSTEPFQIGRWERSDENPDLATDDGKIDLGKPNGLGTVGNVDYNPYIHIRPTTVNKQFKNAWERDDLVYVRTKYPESELTSGYQAEKAKKAVGRHDWNGGELILSRWDKPVEIVPWEKVADAWVDEFKDRGVEFDIVPPKLLPILMERGVEILPPHAGMGKRCNDAYREKVLGNNPDGPQGGVRFSLSETRTDEDGNEVYTERREDGTMDREITTYQDGRKRARWFDKDENLKEETSYYPNGDTREVVNYNSAGDITRVLRYDENRRLVRHYQADTYTDLTRDENGVMQGYSNGVKIRPYGVRFSLSDEEIREKVGDRLTERNYNAVKEINPLLQLVRTNGYSPFKAYREVFTEPTLDDYYIDTKATFKPVDADWEQMKSSGKYEWHQSPKSDSEYLVDRETGDIYRRADHWGSVASCYWKLDGDTEGVRIGVANIKDFSPIKNRDNKVRNDEHDESYSAALDATIGNYETLLSSGIEMSRAVRERAEKVLGQYRELKARYERSGYLAPQNQVHFSLSPTFYSNAERAVEGVKQEKAKAEQWKAMLTKQGGIKAGEDKWMGLSTWLDEHKGETLTKDEVRQFVAENGVVMYERNYSEILGETAQKGLSGLREEFETIIEDGKENEAYFDGDVPEDWGAYAMQEMVERYGDDFALAFEVVEDRYGEPTIEPALDYNDEMNDAAKHFLGVGIGDTPDVINRTRLEYTTEGLDNKREIAFVVPGVEPYQEHDEIHFGPENQGRAVMWVRFGETTDIDGKRVLVIDEVQSNRHQDAREKGYKNTPEEKRRIKQIDAEVAELEKRKKNILNPLINSEKFKGHITENGEDGDYMWDEFNKETQQIPELADIDSRLDELYQEKGALSHRFDKTSIPAAPFEKNWHEVAMKRMLRLAAEEGFDKVAWTTGEQQAERYGLGSVVENIEAPKSSQYREIKINFRDPDAGSDTVVVDDDGIVDGESNTFNAHGKHLSEVVGKELADKLLDPNNLGKVFGGNDLRIGGQGMIAFYDEILPQFMNKYGKRWGVKVGEVTLNTPGRETMHSVDVNEDMRRSVVEQGQPLFSLAEDMEGWQSEQVSWERSALDHLLQNAARNEESKSIRSQAVQAVNRTLCDLFERMGNYDRDIAIDISRGTRAATTAQRKYDRWTVDSLVSMAKSMLKSGMYDGLSPYEVNRLIGKINQGAGRAEIQEQMNTVFDVLMNANLNGWKGQLKKLTSLRDVRINQQGVRVMGQVDKMGSVMLRSLRDGMQLTQEELADKIAEVSDRLASDNSIDADNAAVEMEGLILAQQYNDLIGKYDADNKGIKAEIRKQLEKIYDFWREPVVDEEGNIEYRKDGLMKTVEKRRLKPEYGGLDEDGNRVTPTEEAKAERKRIEGIVASLESKRRENQVQMSEGYAQLTDALGGGVAAAVTRAKEFREGEKRRKQEIYHAANSDLLGVDDNTETVDPSQQASPNNWSFVRGLLGPLATFEKMMRFFGRRSANGEGRLFNMFVRRQIDCGDAEWRSKKAGMDEMDAKAKELFGKKWMTMGNEMRDGKKFPPITLSYFDKVGKPRTIELRQDEAVYLYCVNKMRDGRMKLEAMGIDGDMVEQIVQRLDPHLVELADWYQGEFLPKHRSRYNEVYERMFGTPMARIENYIHLNINKKETASNQEIGEPIGDQRGPTHVTGSIKERKTNVTPIELRTSIFDLAWSEHDKMEHWAAWGEYSRDLKDLLNYRNFKAKVRNMKSVEFGNGKELLENFRRCAAIVTGDYDNPGRHAKIDRAATNLAKGVTSAKIGFRVFTALKQTLSFPAFFSDARPDDLLFAMGNIEGTIEWAMENLPGFSKRWQSRQAGDTRLMETDSDWKVWKNSAVKTIGRYSMLPNAAVDCITVAIGARGVYLTAKRRYLSYGYTEAQAEKKALQDAAISYNASQQSSEGAFTSAQQVDRTLAGVATTVFRNASMGYERRFTQGIRNLKNMSKSGYREEVIENTKKQMMEEGLSEEQAQRAAERVYNRMKWHSMLDVVNFGFVLPFFWNLGPAMVYILGGDDDEQKKELIRDSALHALYGPIEGLSMGGTISELANIITGSMLMDEKSLKETMQGLRHRNFNPLPIVSDMQSLFNAFGTDTWSGVNDVFNLVVQMGTGVNPETATNMTWGIIDACQGDMDLSKKAAFAFLRFINAPSSQVDKLYMDELGITKDEASKMSWDELAKKYARYHAVKGATVVAPFLSDEAEEAREEKYVDKFYKRAAEQLEKAGDEDLQRVYGRGEEQRKEIAKAKAKQEGLENEKYAKKPNGNTKESTKKAYDAYARKRSYSDMAEDILLQKAEKEANDNGDESRAKAIHDVIDDIAGKVRGDEKKGIKGIGVDKKTDERILKEIRETRAKALKEFGITK